MNQNYLSLVFSYSRVILKYGNPCAQLWVFLLQIRKDYYEDKVTAGPQSRVLEGLTWEEAQQLQVGVWK